MTNKDHILDEFIEKMRLARKVEIKQSSMDQYRWIANIFYPFTSVTKNIINEKLQGKSPYTHNLYLHILKELVTYGYIDPQLISHLRRKRTENKYKSKNQLLSRENLQRLIEIRPELQMKAFYSLLYESGTRIRECLGIQRQDVFTLRRKDETIEYNILVSGKTGSREIPLVECLSYLLPYLAHRDNFPGQLWQVAPTENELVYTTVKDRLKRDLLQLGIKKKPNLTFHTFRHSRATELAAILPVNVLMSFFGWTNIETAMKYVHLAGKDVRNAINSYYGLDQLEEKVKLTICPVCKIPLNESLEKCPQCNYAFTRKYTKTKKESAKSKFLQLLNDPDFASSMLQLLEQGLDKMEEKKE